MHLLHQPWNFSNLHMQPFLHLLRFSLLAVNDELVGFFGGKKKNQSSFYFYFSILLCSGVKNAQSALI